jgi:hypothetical protein
MSGDKNHCCRLGGLGGGVCGLGDPKSSSSTKAIASSKIEITYSCRRRMVPEDPLVVRRELIPGSNGKFPDAEEEEEEERSSKNAKGLPSCCIPDGLLLQGIMSWLVGMCGDWS